MRIRTVKPEFWTNQDLIGVSEFARLMALALLNYCDDEGYFNASPVLIRGAVFPFESDLKRVESALNELHKIDYIRLGQTEDGKKLGFVVTFAKHQYIQKRKPSSIKDLCEFRYHSDTSTIPIPDEYHGERKGKEGNGTERNGTNTASSQVPAIQPEQVFLTFPTAGKVTEWVLTKDFVAELQQHYPAVNVEAEAKAAHMWVKTNNKKTASGMAKFLNGWMSRSQNRGSSNANARNPQDAFKTGFNPKDYEGI